YKEEGKETQKFPFLVDDPNLNLRSKINKNDELRQQVKGYISDKLKDPSTPLKVVGLFVPFVSPISSAAFKVYEMAKLTEDIHSFERFAAGAAQKNNPFAEKIMNVLAEKSREKRVKAGVGLGMTGLSFGLGYLSTTLPEAITSKFVESTVGEWTKSTVDSL